MKRTATGCKQYLNEEQPFLVWSEPTMTAKILSITSKSLGGSGVHLTALGRGISTALRSDLVYSRSGRLQDNQLEESFSNVYLLPERLTFNPKALIKDFIFLVRLLRKERYDIIHTHTSLGGLLGRLAALFSPGSTVIHTLHAFGANPFTPKPKRWVYWMIEKLLDFCTDMYVAPSRFMMEYGEAIHLVKERKTAIIYNALPLEGPTKAIKQSGSCVRTAVGLADDETVFLFCGRLEQQKGGDILIRAAASLRDQRPFKVMMCGDGVLIGEFKKLTIELGVEDRFIWLGWQDDVTPFFAAADIFIMPSRWESFGLVFLEAMNHELPVLSTAVEGIPEVVEHEVTGLLCAREDVAGLANNMLRLIDDKSLQKRLGSNGRIRLAKHFPYAKFVNEHILLYARLLSQSAQVDDTEMTSKKSISADQYLV